jgi:hypothetical protein
MDDIETISKFGVDETRVIHHMLQRKLWMHWFMTLQSISDAGREN